MGAELWCHETSWQADADAALEALQESFFDEMYDLSVLLPRKLDSARESVAAAKEDGDPYGLADMYQQQVNLLESLCGRPIPEGARPRIEILRRINAAQGDDIGNVLDVKQISRHRGVHMAQRLDELEIKRLVGVPRPSREQALEAVDKINAELGRGEAVCFPIYKDATPVGWYFVGNTVD
jgi:hypothetical protein